MPGVGKIALSAMMPILSAKGIDVASLPTALVSNTLDFGKFDILDTTDYMEKTVDIWHDLGFRFDCISTGFMISPKQINIVERLINNQDTDNLLVVVDPIMGDEGKLYNGMTDNNVAIMRKLSSYADILIPNFTEACFLTNHFYSRDTLSQDEADKLIERVRQLGSKSVVITSTSVNGENCVIGYDHTKDENFKIGFELIDVRFPGTGDIFSAVLVSDVLNGVIQLNKKPVCLFDTVAQAMSGIVYAAEKKKIAVSVDCPENLTFSHDSKWTSEALFNLLDNAVKYTPAGGKITVSVIPWEMYVEIKVADTGKGISESNQAAIFRRFYREEEVHEQQGVGIGLYLTREIVTRQGGYIKVVSEPGKGSEFSIMLPTK